MTQRERDLLDEGGWTLGGLEAFVERRRLESECAASLRRENAALGQAVAEMLAWVPPATLWGRPVPARETP
mgnify:CR=1 FL=1